VPGLQVFFPQCNTISHKCLTVNESDHELPVNSIALLIVARLSVW